MKRSGILRLQPETVTSAQEVEPQITTTPVLPVILYHMCCKVAINASHMRNAAEFVI